MVAGYSAAQVRAAERPLLDAGEPLMRRAAAGLAAAIRHELDARGAVPGRVLVLAGSGDNGGDAMFAAAELAEGGAAVEVVAASERLHAEAADAARAAGATLRTWPDVNLATALAASDVVVDGLLGTGTSGSGALRGAARDLVAAVLDALRGRRPLVVAVDLPSGVHPDDGSVPDPTVLRADLTVTFGAAKAGLLIEPGADLAGRIEVVDLGLEPFLAGVEPVVERA